MERFVQVRGGDADHETSMHHPSGARGDIADRPQMHATDGPLTARGLFGSPDDVATAIDRLASSGVRALMLLTASGGALGLGVGAAIGIGTGLRYRAAIPGSPWDRFLVIVETQELAEVARRVLREAGAEAMTG